MARIEHTRRIHPGHALLMVALVFGSVAFGSLRLRPKVVSGQVAPSAAPRVPDPFPTPPELRQIDLLHQTEEMAAQKSFGCIQCHREAHDPHYKASLRLG